MIYLAKLKSQVNWSLLSVTSARALTGDEGVVEIVTPTRDLSTIYMLDYYVNVSVLNLDVSSRRRFDHSHT